VYFVVAIRAKWDRIINVIRASFLFCDYMMNLNLVKRRAETTPSPSISKKLFDFLLLESHVIFSFLANRRCPDRDIC
jgi:hypothetical protein